MSEPEFLYATIAMPHNGGHGAWPAVILLTPNPVAAVLAARGVESLGFELNWHDHIVRVDRLPVGMPLSRAVFKENPNLTVFSRYQTRTHVDRELEIVEDVTDADLAHTLGVTVCDGIRHSVRL
ncbi:MAG: hypothetical protein IT405_02545 [Candidatus Yanofskybacteria bacterium]|nr:hypothetical protein [Candidatus Yanofskybacteria bacterium]